MSSKGCRRAYSPKASCLRAKLLVWFTENPTQMLTRQEIMDRFGAGPKGLDYAVSLLRRDGHIKSLFGPHRIVYYAAASLPVMKPPKVKKEKLLREWSSTSNYVPPKPVAISVFEWRP